MHVYRYEKTAPPAISFFCLLYRTIFLNRLEAILDFLSEIV